MPSLDVSSNTFFSAVQSAAPEQEAASLLETLGGQIQTATRMKNRDEASRAIVDAESAAVKALDEMRRRFRVARPNGVGLSKQLRREWEASVAEVQRLEASTFQSTSDAITKTVSELAHRARLDVSMRIRMERAITEKIVDTQRRAASERKETREALDGLNTEVTTVTREIVQELDAVIADVRTELARLDLAELDDKAIVDKRQGMELELVAVADRNLEALTSITEDLRALHWARDDDGRFIGMGPDE